MLTDKQVAAFHRDGYLAVDRLLDYELDVRPVIEEYEALLDKLCEQWLRDGLLQENYSGLPFEKRLVEVYRGGCSYEQAFDIALPNSDVAIGHSDTFGSGSL